MPHEEVAEEESDSDYNAESRPSVTLEESSKSNPLKKFTYVTETGENGKKFFIKTPGQDVVAKVYKDKVKYDKYCLKMLNRWAQGKITKCDVLTRGKGPINLKVHIDGGSSEIIYNFKISDLHMQQKLDDIHKPDQELELDLSRPLEEQDLTTKLNQLAKRKMKNADDLLDYFKSTKRQDFISIEDFRELNNDMLYHVQEIFFRLHQGPRIDVLAKTFNFLLAAEVVKRNLNPNKHMRLIEQLRQ
ncbi:hypothetical protein Tco_1066340 [Tanacetum coccineum]|uniref:Uncharacterized protein n=1 Tax=Tanacetum coccineum TaxID=301880 RepID=A0ABQ5HBU2_9ASTR